MPFDHGSAVTLPDSHRQVGTRECAIELQVDSPESLAIPIDRKGNSAIKHAGLWFADSAPIKVRASGKCFCRAHSTILAKEFL